MLKTDEGRYDQALHYIGKISGDLKKDVDRLIGAGAKDAGAEISISDAGHDKPGTKADRDAIRALMLLQIAYFRKPYAKDDYASAWVIGNTLTTGLTRTKQDIDDEIREYLPIDTASTDDVAAAAERINSPTGVFDPVTYRRTSTVLHKGPICYHGVGAWLFSAGVVSRRWLARAWNKIDANTCNIILGDGRVVDRRNWGLIPAGWVWNVHRVGDKTTCHWGVSVGNDLAIACNNTDESPTRKLAYIRGDTKYGKFRFTELCEVMNGTVKYGHNGPNAPTQDNIVIRQFDPSDPPTPYY